MDLSKAHVLITGGSEGIGYGLATRFLHAGSEVLITGRNAQKLQDLAGRHPGLKTLQSDMGDPHQRETLASYVRQHMPAINMIINNAGIQRRIPLALDQAPWSERQNEIDILLSGPIHLNHLLIPLLLSRSGPTIIVNVTSGGAYIPQAFAPVYSACKAALHSYTVTLRHSLAGTSCRVVELVPPAVQTALAGMGSAHGADLNEFCDSVFPRLTEDGVTDVGFGPTANLTPELSGKAVTEYFQASAGRFPVKTYAEKP